MCEEEQERYVDDPVEDFIWAARTGDLSALKESLLKVSDVNAQDPETGSTALHMACANGHSDCVEFLLQCENIKPNLTNKSGSTPLHWAVQNGQVNTCKLLCARSDIDVLYRNALGKGSTTLAIEKGDTEIIQVLLEHASAAPLEPPINTTEQEDDTKQSEEQIHDSIYQYMKSSSEPNPTFVIREVGTRPQSLAELAEGDAHHTNYTVWAASIILARWVSSEVPVNSSILELGCGCGLAGIVAHRCCKPSRVLLTDLEVKPHLLFNIQSAKKKMAKSGKNKSQLPTIATAPLDWTNLDTIPQDWLGQTDVLLGSDLVYDLALVQPLVDICSKLSKPKTGLFLYVTANRDRAGLDKFLQLMKKHFTLESKSAPPAEYLTNPLGEEKQDFFELHLADLQEVKHTMYRFRKL